MAGILRAAATVLHRRPRRPGYARCQHLLHLCQFPPQVSRVGQRHHLSFSADPICAGPRPAATLPLDTTSALYDDPLPAVFEVSQTS